MSLSAGRLLLGCAKTSMKFLRDSALRYAETGTLMAGRWATPCASTDAAVLLLTAAAALGLTGASARPDTTANDSRRRTPLALMRDPPSWPGTACRVSSGNDPNPTG